VESKRSRDQQRKGNDAQIDQQRPAEIHGNPVRCGAGRVTLDSDRSVSGNSTESFARS
jgi:hypothetical protein